MKKYCSFPLRVVPIYTPYPAHTLVLKMLSAYYALLGSKRYEPRPKGSSVIWVDIIYNIDHQSTPADAKLYDICHEWRLDC